MLLQSMIRAAGVYIKLEHGYYRQAAKLAEKACTALEKHGRALRGYCAPEELIAALKSLNPVPPILLSQSFSESNPSQGEIKHVRREEGSFKKGFH
jgi:hypothetical protein